MGGLRQRKIIDQHEKLLALGTITGQADPSTEQPGGGERPRGRRSARAWAGCGTNWRCWPTGSSVPSAARPVIQEEVAEQVAKVAEAEPSALETSDREEQIGVGSRGARHLAGVEYAPTFVEAGLDVDWPERVAASVESVDCSASLQGAVGWLKYTIDAS